MLTAFRTSSRPVDQPRGSADFRVAVEVWHLVARRIDISSAGVSVGSSCRINATVPATIGVEKLVPATMPKPPPRNVVSTSSPGARIVDRNRAG